MNRLWLLALTAALFTTACRMEANVLIDLNPDESGSFEVELGLDEELQTQISEQLGVTIDFGDLLSGGVTDQPGAAVTQRTDGDMSFSGARFSFNNQAELQEVLSAGAGDGGDVTVVWSDDSVTIDAFLGGSAAGLGLGGLADGFGNLGGGLDLDGLDVAGGLALADAFFSGSVIVSMPGEITSHNANRVMDDGRLQWDLTLDGSDTIISATSDRSGGGGGFPLWALILIVVTLLAVVLWMVSLQRRRDSALAAVDAIAAPPEPAGWEDAGSVDSTEPSSGNASEDDPA